MESATNQPDWEALARYLAGEAPAAEARQVERWLEAHPVEAGLLGAVERALPGPSASAGAIDVEAALRRVSDRITADRATGVLSFPQDRERKRWPRIGLAAAAVLAAVAALTVLRELSQRPPVTQTMAAQTISTEVGQRDSLLLTDGTHVLLGPGSRLNVAAGYGERHRQVELVGQAYFEVAHDAERPFTVQTGNALIQDVGTAFTVRTGQNGAVVAVTEGTVLLRATAAGDPGVFLQPGDRGIVTANARASAQKGAVSVQDTAWRHGRLVFRDAPLSDVQLTLRRWYGIELRLADSLIARRHLTASFEGESIDQVLRVIGLALGASVERHADTAMVRLTPPPARTQ